MKAKVYITLKAGVLDPQGKATEQALHRLGFKGIREVRQGKIIEIDFDQMDSVQARKDIENMCQKLLSNTVIEDYSIELDK